MCEKNQICITTFSNNIWHVRCSYVVLKCNLTLIFLYFAHLWNSISAAAATYMYCVASGRVWSHTSAYIFMHACIHVCVCMCVRMYLSLALHKHSAALPPLWRVCQVEPCWSLAWGSAMSLSMPSAAAADKFVAIIITNHRNWTMLPTDSCCMWV